MNPLTGLTDYLRRVERRLRVQAFTKGAAIMAAAALVFTVLAVLLANAVAFSDPSVTTARVLLFLALALALGIGLVVPLLPQPAQCGARHRTQIPGVRRASAHLHRARADQSRRPLSALAGRRHAGSQPAGRARARSREQSHSQFRGGRGGLAGRAHLAGHVRAYPWLEIELFREIGTRPYRHRQLPAWMRRRDQRRSAG